MIHQGDTVIVANDAAAGPRAAASPATAAESGGRPRVLFYSHDGTGLGHLRITLPLATALARQRPDASLLALTGSLQTHAFDLPPNLDYVKLPSVPKRRLYEGLPPAPARGAFKNVIFLREAIARATALAFSPHLVVVDHAPAGLFRELAAALETLHATTPRPRLVLLMRDITFGPTQTRDLWRKEGVYDLLDRVYDRILVYGQREIFDPIAEYELSPTVAVKTAFCGYLRPPAPARPEAEVRAELGADDRPLAVVTVGGGADGGPLLRTYLRAVNEPGTAEMASFVVTGPLLDAAERAELSALAAGLPHVRLVPFVAGLESYLRAADVVVTMGGYNAVCEAVAAGKRAIVVPRTPGPEEQLIRAERFARRGLVTLMHPDQLTPERLRLAIRAELARGTSPARPPLFDGSNRILAELALALERDAAAERS